MEKRSVVYRIGIGGWEHEVFDQCLYPRTHMESEEKLNYYARFFDTVEVRQTSWDDSLGADDARQWIGAVAQSKRFTFNVKLHTSFTHRKEIKPAVTTRVRSVLQELSRHERLGFLVAQFPYSFTNTSAHRYHLSRLSEVFRGFPICVELRHASWDQSSIPSFLAEHSLAPISADLPRLTQYAQFNTGNRGERAYVRLHGRNEKGWLLNGVDTRYDYLYNSKEVREVCRRIDAFPGRCNDITIICNNTTGGKGVANALQLIAALRQTNAVLVPAATLRAFPFLHTISAVTDSSPSLLGEHELLQAV